MTLSPGIKLGPYEILTPIGAGGMGEVYKARDTRLGRDVAVKVLPEEFAHDPERLARFEREARAVAALNHPNILSIYDFGKEGDTAYTVTELLEGETLRERLSSGALPVRKAVEYAAQIAKGLAAAHDKGIVHRDLKPENLFVTKDGHIKILDFGLAGYAASPDSSDTKSPTITRHTEPGTLMGTLGYMSPEQARGKPADQRSDIFSLGAVLYEMVSGKRAFEGESQADVLSAILKEDPSELDPALKAPPGLVRIVDTCLAKDTAARFHSAHDLAFALEGVSGSGTVSGPSTLLSTGAPKVIWREVVAWGLALLGLCATAIAILWSSAQSGPSPGIIRTTITDAAQTPIAGDGDWYGMALSLDGRKLVFVGIADGVPALFLRRLDAAEAQMLAGTEGASFPSWSPDGSQVAFAADQKLKVYSLMGGTTRVLCPVARWSGMSTWAPDGTLYFTPDFGQPIHRMRSEGGQPEPVGRLDAAGGEALQVVNAVLPGGRHLLYGSQTWTAVRGIFILDLERGTSRPLLPGALRAATTRDAVAFVEKDTLFGQRFDSKSMRPVGERVELGRGLRTAMNGDAQFSLAQDGTLAFLLPRRAATCSLAWFDSGGRRTGTCGGSPWYRNVALSRDGRKVLADVQAATEEGGSGEIRLIDTVTNAESRLAFEGSFCTDAVWSPDGSRIAFSAWKAEGSQILESDATGRGTPRLLAERRNALIWARHWSPDGRTLLIDDAAASPSGFGVLQVSTSEPGHLKAYRVTAADNFSPRFSPDGRWVAYASNQSGRDQVYVAGFPNPGTPRQVSTIHGVAPRWRQDGRELYFLEWTGKVMKVAVSPSPSGLEFGAPAPLFSTRVLGVFGACYDVAPDGRFLVSTVNDEGTSIVLVQNWLRELKR